VEVTRHTLPDKAQETDKVARVVGEMDEQEKLPGLSSSTK